MSKIDLSDKAKEKLKEFFKLGKEEAVKKISGVIYASKYGKATTHMDKLLLRLDRGVGNPCPFILIGIGKQKLVNEKELY